MSKLDAVNRCLKAIGEDPVMSLTSGLDDAENAEDFLEATSRQVQESGWYCNTEPDVVLQPGPDGTISLPFNALKVTPSGFHKFRKLRNQSGKLYDVKANSNVFSGPVTCTLVFELDFEDLDFALQDYISAVAAQTYQSSVMGSTSLDGFTTRDVQSSWIRLLTTEAENEDSNVLDDNSFSQVVTGRYNRLR